MTTTAAETVVHPKCSVAKLKAMCKAMGEMRYVLDPDGNLHCANSRYFIHNSIKNETFRYIERPKGLYIQGYARWNGEKFEHWVSYTCNEVEDNLLSGADIREHFQDPRIEKLHERGFVRNPHSF